MNSLRTVASLGLLATALAASAQTVAYSSLGTSGGPVTGVGTYFSGTPTSLFTSGASAPLVAFQVLISNGDAVPASFNARLFANVPPTATSGAGSTDTVGAQLGLFTGVVPGNGNSGIYSLVTIPATGVSLVSGTRYWLELDGGTFDARGNSQQAWSAQTGAPNTTIRANNVYITNANPFGFSVLVAGQPTPEPSALAALGLGAVAFVKRRKRA